MRYLISLKVIFTDNINVYRVLTTTNSKVTKINVFDFIRHINIFVILRLT